MSRIISGAAGGVRLASVPGDNTRPTTDRVKESLFSKLESYDIIRGARVLDAFGGSGALGCEALSRGAASVTLLDTYPKAVAVIRKNVAALEKAMGRTGSSGATGSAARVQQSQALTYVKSASGPWDLVFVDPPYAMPNEQCGARACTDFRPVSTVRRFSTMWSLTRWKSKQATSSATNPARTLKSSQPKPALAQPCARASPASSTPLTHPPPAIPTSDIYS